MDSIKYEQSASVIDIPNKVEKFAGNNSIHRSHLRRVMVSSELTEVPDEYGMLGDHMWHQQALERNHEIDIGAKVTLDLPEMLLNLELIDGREYRPSDSTMMYFDVLRGLAEDMRFNRTVLLAHALRGQHQRMPSIQWEGFPDLLLANLDGACDKTIESLGFIPGEYGWGYDHEDVSVIKENFLNAVASDGVWVADAIAWFEDQLQNINSMYRFSVNLINWFSHLGIKALYELYGKDHFDGNWWWKEPRTDANSFFNRYFQANYLGQSEKILDTNTDMVISLVQKADAMDKSIQPYLGHLAKFMDEPDKSLFFTDEVAEWRDWYKVRTEWYKSYEKVREWLYNQNDYRSNEWVEPHLKTMMKLQLQARKSEADLDVLAADQILSARKVGGEGRRKSIEQIAKTVERFNVELRDKGLEYRLVSIEKERIKERTRNAWVHSAPLSQGGTIQYNWTELVGKLRQDILFQDDKEKGYTDLDRMTEIESLLIDARDTRNDELKSWINALQEYEEVEVTALAKTHKVHKPTGKCNRKEIGRQKVGLKDGKEPTDGAVRNAAMRFLANDDLPFTIEPVDQFEELTESQAIKESLTKFLRAEGANDKEVRQAAQRLKKAGGEVDQARVFCMELAKFDLKPDEIERRLGNAYKEVGKKKPTHKTLYDAEHVALAFLMDEKVSKRGPVPTKKKLLPENEDYKLPFE